MSIYPIHTIEASARQAAAIFGYSQEIYCPYPDWQDAANIWRNAFDAEVERLYGAVAA